MIEKGNPFIQLNGQPAQGSFFMSHVFRVLGRLCVMTWDPTNQVWQSTPDLRHYLAGEVGSVKAIEWVCPVLHDSPPVRNLLLILLERVRQVAGEGFAPGRDIVENPHGELAGMAACYALSSTIDSNHQNAERAIEAIARHWPIDIGWFKPGPRDLLKSGALVLAEMERRAAVQVGGVSSEGGEDGG